MHVLPARPAVRDARGGRLRRRGGRGSLHRPSARAGRRDRRRRRPTGILTPTTRPATDPEVPMSQHPRAGQPALPELIDVAASSRRTTTIRPAPTTSRSRSPSAPPATAVGLHRRSTRPTSWPRPRPSPLPGRAGHRRPAVHRPRHPRPARSRPGGRRWRCWRQWCGGVGRQRRTATPRRRRVARDPDRNRGRTPPRRRHRRHPVAQPARDGGFKYNPPNGGPADTDVTGIQAGQRDPGRRAPTGRGFRRCPRARAHQRATTTSWRLRRRPAQRRRHRGHPRLGAAAGADPLGGAASPTGASIGERHGLDLTVVNPVDPTSGS